MDEKDCELIEMLWETRNITKAAERLFTTQSALTKRIQKLEEELGCELFIRSRKGVLFTPVAERILPYVRQVSDSMDRIRSQVAIYRKEVAGTLKLGVSINFARYRLADVLKGFMDQYPNVDIHVSTMQSTNLYQSLVKNEIKTPHHDKSPYNRAIQYFETFTKSNLSPDIDRKTDIHEQKCKNRGNQYGQNLADERNHAQQNHADQIDKKKIGQKKRPFSEESQTIQDPVPACSGFQ